MRCARSASRNAEGFTLLELMVAFTIMALISVALFFSFRMGLNAYQKGQDRITEEASNRVLEDQIKRQIGFDFIFLTTAKTDEEGRSLLSELGMPFRDIKKDEEAAEGAAA